MLGGGVACSRTLASLAAQRLNGLARVAVASPRLNADNAAMIPAPDGIASASVNAVPGPSTRALIFRCLDSNRCPTAHCTPAMTIYPFVLQLGPITLTGYSLMMMAAS